MTSKQQLELIKLCEFDSGNSSFKLLYTASRDGFRGSDFHLKCDGHANTLTILKAKGTEFIFGGFTSVTWDGAGWKSDPNAFLFSLTNKEKKPCKMKIDPDKKKGLVLIKSIESHVLSLSVLPNSKTMVMACENG